MLEEINYLYVYFEILTFYPKQTKKKKLEE